jgi:hypothetical protein
MSRIGDYLALARFRFAAFSLLRFGARRVILFTKKEG